jgi:hypothetical protein
MAELVADCPRCGTGQITFDVTAAKIIGVHYDWQRWYETFCICRRCNRATIFVLRDSVNADYQYIHKVGILSLCVDLATRSMLPSEEVEGLNAKVRRDLGLRLPWLFDKGLLPATLKELSSCIKEDGNDGAHAGTLKKSDAEDLLDFTAALLERMYTEPERLRLAQERRDARRSKGKG